MLKGIRLCLGIYCGHLHYISLYKARVDLTYLHSSLDPRLLVCNHTPHPSAWLLLSSPLCSELKNITSRLRNVGVSGNMGSHGTHIPAANLSTTRQTATELSSCVAGYATVPPTSVQVRHLSNDCLLYKFDKLLDKKW